jgi:hypothetical protein
LSITDSRQFIRNVRKHPENFYVVHYSCQSLYDDSQDLSPRITSIAIAHFSSEQTISFSTHAIAEELHIAREDVKSQFDLVEINLLRNFYDFVRDRRDKYYVHWNMRNLTYGFEHLEHRYRVLGGVNPPVIPVEQRLNLNDLLADRYGDDYAPHPKLKTLMGLNGGVHRHFLSGEEEVNAFENNEFLRMHNSTLSKVGFIISCVRKLINGTLQTASKGFGVALDRLFESRVAKAVGLFGALVGIPVSFWQLLIWFRGG